MTIYMAMEVESYKALQQQLRHMEQTITQLEHTNATGQAAIYRGQREVLTSIMSRMFPVVVEEPVPVPDDPQMEYKNEKPEKPEHEVVKGVQLGDFLRQHKEACNQTQRQTLSERLKDNHGFYTKR